MRKRRSALDARPISRPREEAGHPFAITPGSLASIRHEMAEARRGREPWERGGGTFEVGQVPAAGFNTGGAWGGTE